MDTSKVLLLPWSIWDTSLSSMFYIRDANGLVVADIVHYSRGWVYFIVGTAVSTPHISCEIATTACNERLKELGYVFIEEARADKLRLLL